MALAPKLIALINGTGTYIPGAGEAATISTVSIHNPTAGTLVSTINIGAANNATDQFSSINIPADGTVILTIGITLSDADTLYANGASLNTHLFGILET